MKLVRLLKLLITFGVLYILSQLIVFLIWPQQDAVSEKIENSEKEHYKLIKVLDTFQKTWRENRITVFIIDPHILREILLNINGPKNNSSLLSWERITFGVFHENSHQFDSLFQRLSESGFSLVVQHDDYPSAGDENIGRKVPTHVFLTYDDSALFYHIVIFYERTGGYLWHSAVKSTGSFNSDLKFGKHAGVYDRFILQQIEVQGTEIHVLDNIVDFLNHIPSSIFIECNHTRAKQFRSHYLEEMSIDAARFQGKARQLLSRAKQILDALKIQFWLSSGTCLGWYRQCDIITYSKDVDIGIWIKDYKEELMPAFEQNGFHLKHIFGKVTDSYELSFEAGDIKLDIFFFYEEGNFMWNGGTQAKSGKKFKYYFPKFTLCWTDFLDMKIRVPCEAESYIEANYGKNWFVPVKDWDWKSSAFNVQENGMWPEEEWDTVIQVFQIDNDNR